MGDLKELTKDIVKVIVFSILFVSILIVLGIIGGTIEANQANQSEKEYNNGICSECGGHYKFVSSSHINNISISDEYYYSCEDCGYTIMTHIFYRGGNWVVGYRARDRTRLHQDFIAF